MASATQHSALSTLHCTVPIPPSLNNAYTNGRGHGRRVLTADGRAYKAHIGLIARNQAQLTGWAIAPQASLELEIALYFANRRRRDVDNCIKLVLDGLAGALGFDDRAVCDIRVHRAGLDPHHPRCEVTLRSRDEP